MQMESYFNNIIIYSAQYCHVHVLTDPENIPADHGIIMYPASRPQRTSNAHILA